MPRTPSKTKTLQPVDDNVQRGAATPGTKMRQLKEDLQNKETENETLRGDVEKLTKVIAKIDLIKDGASVSIAPPKDEKKSKKAPIVPAKTAYKFFCESQKKQDNMQQVWKECAPEVRQKYQALAKADKDRYNSEMEAYNGEQKALEMYYEKKKQEQAMAFYEAHLEAQALLEKTKEGDGKTKKKKAVKDPDAPKRCTSSYMFFAQEMRPSVVKDHPDAKVTEISKILGEMWNKEKSGKGGAKKYEDMATKDRERYNKEKEVYDAMMAERKVEAEKEAAARFEQEKKEAMELLESQSVQINQINIKNGTDNVSVITDGSDPKQAKKKKDPNAPKRALTAYNYFVKENRDSIKSKMPENTTNAELMTEIGKKWKETTDAKKKKYNKMAAKDQERYAKEMEQYNATKN